MCGEILEELGSMTVKLLNFIFVSTFGFALCRRSLDPRLKAERSQGCIVFIHIYTHLKDY